MAIAEAEDEAARARLEAKLWSEDPARHVRLPMTVITSRSPAEMKTPPQPEQEVPDESREDPLGRLVHSITSSHLTKPAHSSTPARVVGGQNSTGSREVGKFFQGIAKPHLPKFDGNRDLYEDWRAQFEVFVEQAEVPIRFKMIMLKNALIGRAGKLVENLGFTEAQYSIALFKLDQRYGGESRILKKYIDQLMALNEVSEQDLKGLEDLANHLCDVVSKLADTDHAQELVGQNTLYALVRRKVPVSLLVKYTESDTSTRIDGLAVFAKWFNHHVCLMIEMTDLRESRRKGPSQTNANKLVKRPDKSTVYASTATAYSGTTSKPADAENQYSFPLCKAAHHIVKCDRWTPTTTSQRWDIAKEKALCYRCLCSNHMGKDCQKGSRKCGIDGCQKNHHRHLHRRKPKTDVSVEPKDHANNMFGVAKDGRVYPSKVALRVIPVYVVGSRGQRQRLNALLDDGSDSTYITRSAAEALNTPVQEQALSVSTLTDPKKSLRSGLTVMTIESLSGEITAKVGARVLDRLCENLPPQNWQHLRDQWSHLKGIEFPRVDWCKTVDILIGADHPELTLALEERPGQLGEPVARLTPLGWTCTGSIEVVTPLTSNSVTTANTYSTITDRQLDESLRSLWNMDVFTTTSETNFTPEERAIIKRTEASKVYTDNRYEVSIPWVGDTTDLPNNFQEARRRLLSIERTLLKKPHLAEKYCDWMRQNIQKGYLQEIEAANAEGGWYLPHFPVVREDKETTKVRIVFDSAAKCQGVSLNDAMLAGPKLQRDIFDILARFRRGPVGLIGDIKEMFSQVMLNPKDRAYHRNLWRDLDLTAPIKIYESTRVTFGDKASPFLAQYVLQSHARTHQDQYPEGARVCQENTYMDDAIDSQPDTAATIKLRCELSALLLKAGFFIRRWCSNESGVLEGVPREDCAAGIVDLQDSTLMPSVKTLGIKWNAATDMLEFSTQNIAPTAVMTKRTLLSRVATLFDPLQWLSPFTIRVKIVLQQSWVLGLTWDEPLPSGMIAEARDWFAELKKIEGISIPRCYFRTQPDSEITLHTFSDASSKAYAAVTYIRQQKADGGVNLALVASKARVAPLKTVSIPRLELMAAVLGHRLTQKITTVLKYSMMNVTYWTDSMDVVHWVRNQSRQFKTFVANRVSDLQSDTLPSQWRFVPGVLNPADVATRGMTAREFTSKNVWFDGPDFLYADEDCWPETPMGTKSAEAEGETSRSYVHVTVSGPERTMVINLSKFSTWIRLVRVTMWVLRFIDCLRVKAKRVRGEKLASEAARSSFNWFLHAETVLLQAVQRESFTER
ncbi:uncharacterized protein LOC135500823 [Lineus longissimus]|uniref:uncharacterized protein LOC135500823 n=1 Tax=Lineus longissimus TaxID=88925 RepID=UPI00315C7BDB